MTYENTDLSSILGSHLSQHDVSGLQTPGLPAFTDLVMQLLNGEFDLSLAGILNKAMRLIFNELFLNTQLIRQLLIIAILSALLKCLTDAFKHKSAGELGFFVTFCMMVVLAATSFRVCVGILQELVSTVGFFMEAAIPLVVGALALSGNVAGAAFFHPVLFMGIGLITRFISVVFIPAITAAATLTIVSCLSEENPLAYMAALFKKCAEWVLKGIVGVFMVLLTLQKFSVPVVNNFALSTAKTAVGAVPVVGSAMNAAVDTVLYFGQASRSIIMVALVIVLIFALSAPLIKLLAFMLVYRLLAAAVQPVSEDRFVKCLDGIGTYMGALLGAGAIVGVMCVFAVIILLGGSHAGIF
jgi:stage III sporulation protein AE